VKMDEDDDFYCSDSPPKALSDDMERNPKPDLEERNSESECQWELEDIHELEGKP
jgi:hypothetical protein